MIRGNLIVMPLAGNQLIVIEPVFIEADTTKIPTIARVVFGQLLPDDRKIEWAPTLAAAEDLVVGGNEDAGPTPTGPPGSSPTAAAPGAVSPDRLKQAKAVYHDMQQVYAAGDYVRYGQLMQQAGQDPRALTGQRPANSATCRAAASRAASSSAASPTAPNLGRSSLRAARS